MNNYLKNNISKYDLKDDKNRIHFESDFVEKILTVNTN